MPNKEEKVQETKGEVHVNQILKTQSSLGGMKSMTETSTSLQMKLLNQGYLWITTAEVAVLKAIMTV